MPNPPVTDEERAAYIRALLEERAVYERRGDASHIEAVNAELRRLGHLAAKPSSRAERRRHQP